MPLDPTDQRRQVYGHEAYAPGVGPNANRQVEKPTPRPNSIHDKPQNGGVQKGLEIEHNSQPKELQNGSANVKNEREALKIEITKLNATIIRKEAELKKEADMGVSAVKQAALQCTIKELYNQKQELENSLKQKEFAASVRE